MTTAPQPVADPVATPASAPASGPALRSTARAIRFSGPRTILALILREMGTTYGRTPGGYLWVVMGPALGIAFISAIFSLGFRNPPLGANFAIFYATGLLPFMMYGQISGKVAGAISYSRSLLNYPRVTYLDTMIARVILTVLTQLLVNVILLTFILSVYETRTTLVIGPVLLAYAMTIAFAIGVGVLNCFLTMMFPIWQAAWGIVTRPLLFFSGVILLFESLPEGARRILWWNPLMHVTGEMRSAFYLGYEANYVAPLYVFGVSLALTVIGLIFLGRYHRDMMER
jgi:capsular polysaccharide transport system permease protein